MSNHEDLVGKIRELNEFLGSMPWCDFEVLAYRGYNLLLMGSIDTTAHHNIEIEFSEVAAVSMPFEWKTDTSRGPFSIAEGAMAFRINQAFQIEEGHHVFLFEAEDSPPDAGFFVAAKDIWFRAVFQGEPMK